MVLVLRWGCGPGWGGGEGAGAGRGGGRERGLRTESDNHIIDGLVFLKVVPQGEDV